MFRVVLLKEIKVLLLCLKVFYRYPPNVLFYLLKTLQFLKSMRFCYNPEAGTEEVTVCPGKRAGAFFSGSCC